jgi:hypothetical protein
LSFLSARSLGIGLVLVAAERSNLALLSSLRLFEIAQTPLQLFVLATQVGNLLLEALALGAGRGRERAHRQVYAPV